MDRIYLIYKMGKQGVSERGREQPHSSQMLDQWIGWDLGGNITADIHRLADGYDHSLECFAIGMVLWSKKRYTCRVVEESGGNF